MSHRSIAAGLLALGASLSLASPALAAKHDVKVMTRNLYLGADLIPLAGAKTQAEFEQAAAQRFQTVQANDFKTRAKGLAAEIAKAKPDLVGIQEGSTWYTGAKDGTATKATTVVYDSLTVLLKELRKRDRSYRVVRKRAWFDFEAPTALGFDARLVQQDAIIARNDKRAKVSVRRAFSGGFVKRLDVPTVAGVASERRGWVGVDAKVRGRAFRFVTTHLEAYSADIADEQMGELLAGPLKSKKTRSVLVGDFNSSPGADSSAAYDRALKAGFANDLQRRATCCFPEDLRQVGGPLETWIDQIVTRRKIKAIGSSRVGGSSSDRVGGLWPSDHAGIVATLRLAK